MYPDLFGINDFSYTLCMVVGIILAVLVAGFYLKKKGISKVAIIDLIICTCFAVVGGIIFSILFENLYEAIQLKDQYHWVWKMTFYGGLFGGVLGFLLTYFLMRKNTKLCLEDVLIVAPASIAVAHGVGRIGCFLAGCCYGKHTDSWIGMDFPGLGKVIPTQLIEAIALLLLFGVLCFLAFKKDFKYNFIIYAGFYGVFRFVIEFFRDDERGVAFALSPSQIWCLILVVATVPLYFFLKKFIKSNEQK